MASIRSAADAAHPVTTTSSMPTQPSPPRTAGYQPPITTVYTYDPHGRLVSIVERPSLPTSLG
ncbi:MAG TPA: hypothetical protein VGH74_18355 [Planctomycetaceae bacterium]|jgi:hypothetical protein